MFRKKYLNLSKASTPKKPFEFSVSGQQVIEILKNFPDTSRIKRGINCGPVLENRVLEPKSGISLKEALDSIQDYSQEKDLSTEVEGTYILYWDKKRKEYTHKITLNRARDIDFYLEFGTSSSQSSLDEVFSSR